MQCYIVSLNVSRKGYIILIFQSLYNFIFILANDVAELWKVNEAEAIRNAKEWTRTYAMGN